MNTIQLKTEYFETVFDDYVNLSCSFFTKENQRPNVIGKILEHLSSPEELFKYYPNRPEAVG